MTVELKAKARPLLDPPIVRRATVDALRKLNPRVQVRNPVMFIVEIGSALTTVRLFKRCWGRAKRLPGLSSALPCGCGSR